MIRSPEGFDGLPEPFPFFRGGAELHLSYNSGFVDYDGHGIPFHAYIILELLVADDGDPVEFASFKHRGSSAGFLICG